MNMILKLSISLITLVFLLLPFFQNHSDYNIIDYKKFPILEGGRVKPIDSFARQSLTQIQGKQSLRVDGEKIQPIEWLLKTQSRPQETDTYEIFLVEHPQAFSLLTQSISNKSTVFHLTLMTYNEYILGRAEEASKLKHAQRSPLQQEFIVLRERMYLYSKIKNTIAFEKQRSMVDLINKFNLIKKSGLEALDEKNTKPELIELNSYFKEFKLLADNAAFMSSISKNKNDIIWEKVGNNILRSLDPSYSISTSTMAFAHTRDAYKEKDSTTFNRFVDSYNLYLKESFPSIYKKIKLEYIFNELNLFFKSLILFYITIFYFIFLVIEKTFLLFSL